MRDRRYNNGPDPQVLPALMTVATRQHPHVRDRLAGLADAPRSGRSLTHGPQVRALLIAKACTRPPDTGSGQRRERWTHCELAGEVGMSESQAHVILSRADIKPHRTEQWIMTDFDRPEFEARAGEVCGLYLDRPAGALVLSIDEKTSIQARLGTARQPARAGQARAPRLRVPASAHVASAPLDSSPEEAGTLGAARRAPLISPSPHPRKQQERPF